MWISCRVVIVWITWKINEPWFSVFPGFPICCIHFFLYKQHLYKQHLAEIGKKNWAKDKQHPEAELLLFKKYLLSSSTLSSKNNRAYSQKCAKKQVCLFVCFNEIIWLIIMKVKKKSRSYKYDIYLHLDMGSHVLINIKSASVWWCLYVLSNNQPTLEVQFMKKFRNAEAK